LPLVKVLRKVTKILPPTPMDIHQIEASLNSQNQEERLKAISQLKHYSPEVAVPLLTSRLHDPAFLVRSFVAMGLGRQQTTESFAALFELMKCDRDPNVRAEAANSLSFFGEVAVSHLVMAFHQDEHWLLRRSVLAALIEMQAVEAVYDVCVCAIAGEDLTVQEAGIDGLGTLAGSTKQAEALQQLLGLKNDPLWRIRWRVALALRQFDTAEAREALSTLMQDENHRVVAAALEGSFYSSRQGD
jgi:HEAT repeat protein